MCRGSEIREIDYSALLVYGNNKLFGSLRYLTDYFPVMAGWVSLSSTQTHIFEGTVLLITLTQEELQELRRIYAERYQ